MKDFEYPEFIARFYDVIYHHVRDGVDNHFFLNQAVHSNGKVLEVGAGTGRLFTEALNQGVDIYGVDISKNMTDILKSKIPVHEQNPLQKDSMEFIVVCTRQSPSM
jgi:ubiquinone/menaquinone biosynthesis C-methylase UbiE